MKQRFTIGAIIGSALLASAATFVAVRVGAAGIPTKGALTYTGYLEGENGTPVTTEQMIGLAAYDSSTAGAKVCEVEAKPITPIGGRFQIQLPDTCVAAVSANPELWIEISVGAMPLGRTKLGAVPYAVEAGHTAEARHAIGADSAAAASGVLATSIAALAAKTEIPTVTPWKDYTPIVTNVDSANSPKGYWRIVGDTMEVNISCALQKCTNNNGAAVRWSLPDPYKVDITKLPRMQLDRGPQIGTGYIFYGGLGKDEELHVLVGDSQSVIVDDSNLPNALSCVHFATGGPFLVRMQFSVPITT